MRKEFTIQDATKMAEAYCAKVSQNRRAVYCGVFEGGHLFSLDFQWSGHHGLPIFIIVSSEGEVKEIEAHSNYFYEAWRVSDEYFG